jgi:hypothetical protein
MCFSYVLEMFRGCCMCMLYVRFKQYIYDACGNKEYQLPNNIYYEIQAWKYNEILEI